MSATVESLGQAEGVTGTAPQDEYGRGSWAEALAGTVPFLIIGLATILMESPGNGWVNVSGTFIQGGYVVALVFAPALLGLRRCLVAS